MADGNQAESAAALVRALAEQGVAPIVLTVCGSDVEPTRLGFARRLQKVSLDGAPADLFEGVLTKGVCAWIVRAPAGWDPERALAETVRGALRQLDLGFTVAHAHGDQAIGALEEIGRLRPETIRVATIARARATDFDAVVLPGGENNGAVTIQPGIDEQLWDPSSDSVLPARFGPTDSSGKALCKTALQRSLGLPPRRDVPLIATHEEPARQLLLGSISERLDLSAQFVAQTCSGASFRKLLGGADFLVLADGEGAQFDVLRALRYGVVPLVPADGALAQPIVEYDAPTRSGLGIHYGRDAEQLSAALWRAVDAFRDTESMNDLRSRALSTDVSWARPTRLYLSLFERLARD